jgi:hypothetical protein
MKTSIAAAALALLASFSAAAGGLQRSFNVGAVVVASASVSSRLMKVASAQGIDVRTGGYRAPPAALLVGGQVRMLAESAGASLPAPAEGETVVTVVY